MQPSLPQKAIDAKVTLSRTEFFSEYPATRLNWLKLETNCTKSRAKRNLSGRHPTEHNAYRHL